MEPELPSGTVGTRTGTNRNQRNRNPKFATDPNGVKFGRTELSIPPFEISRRDLHDGHGFKISILGTFGFYIFGPFLGFGIFSEPLELEPAVSGTEPNHRSLSAKSF